MEEKWWLDVYKWVQYLSIKTYFKWIDHNLFNTKIITLIKFE